VPRRLQEQYGERHPPGRDERAVVRAGDEMPGEVVDDVPMRPMSPTSSSSCASCGAGVQGRPEP
jgi:hypothetical protein